MLLRLATTFSLVGRREHQIKFESSHRSPSGFKGEDLKNVNGRRIINYDNISHFPFETNYIYIYIWNSTRRPNENVTKADSDSLLIDENVLYTVRNIHHRYVMVKKKQSSSKTMGIYQNNKLKHTNEKRERGQIWHAKILIKKTTTSLYREVQLGDSCIVYKKFTASIGDLMVANWVYYRVASKLNLQPSNLQLMPWNF